MSTLRVTTLQNASGVEVYTAKAWVNFNGTGTVAIRASGNVSSITDNGTGDYTVNFTNPMPDANYSVTSAADWGTGNEGNIVSYNTNTTISTSALRLAVGVPGTAGATGLTFRDQTFVFVTIFR